MSYQRPILIREPNLRWPIFLLAALITSALLVTGMVLYEMSHPATYLRIEPQLRGALRPGAAGFEELSRRIEVEQPVAVEKLHLMNDTVIELTTTVRNKTGRTIRGLEMRGAVFDRQGELLRERTVVVIPSHQTALEPEEAISVRILLEGLGSEAEHASVLMEVTGVRVD